MGGQIVKRMKKKGRPSKADLASRPNSTSGPPPPPDRDLRRSLRRPNVRYTFNFDDYLDDDEDDYYDDERGREKKLKLLLKLQSSSGAADEPAHSPTRGIRRVSHAPSTPASASSFDDEMPLKKRKIDVGDDEIPRGNGDGNGDGGEDEDNEVEDEEDEVLKPLLGI